MLIKKLVWQNSTVLEIYLLQDGLFVLNKTE